MEKQLTNRLIADRRTAKSQPATAASYLCLGFQTHLAILYFHAVFHRMAAIILADLVSLFLYEGLEGIEYRVGRGGVPLLFARFHHGFEQQQHLFMVAVHVG